MSDIETTRLVLRLVPLAGLAATVAKDLDACRAIIGDVPPEWFDDDWVADMRLQQWKGDPGYAPWSIRAIALKQTGQIVGYMNCHNKPMSFVYDGTTSLAIELGYDIFAAFRRRGFAYEAIRGFTAWARTQGVARIVLSIAPGNEASRALAMKLGAIRIGSQIDEKDGPEDVYLASIAEG